MLWTTERLWITPGAGRTRYFGSVESDVLGAPYQARTLKLPDDDEGRVVATLVRRRATHPTRRAVLYVHGFNDYFFQTHLADFYTAAGWDFYALDLRKYGRSLLAHQTPSFARSMAEYFPELDEAVRIIRAEDGHDNVLFNGHSTGGLAGSLYAHARAAARPFDGLFLNSPFLDFNTPWVLRRPLGPVIAGVGALRPYRAFPAGGAGVYGRSLHATLDGEWDYDLAWKPVASLPARFGWLRGIRSAQLRVRRGLRLDVPILVGHSDASFKKSVWDETAHITDAVLDVDHIVRWAPNLGSDVTLLRVPGAKHDLALSRTAARKQLFASLDDWLSAVFPTATRSRPDATGVRPGATAPTGDPATPPSRAATPADHG
jgi:alpha-beta hydrolase superfamily lysophospholipase